MQPGLLTYVFTNRNYLIKALCFPLSVAWAVEAKSILISTIS